MKICSKFLWSREGEVRKLFSTYTETSEREHPTSSPFFRPTAHQLWFSSTTPPRASLEIRNQGLNLIVGWKWRKFMGYVGKKKSFISLESTHSDFESKLVKGKWVLSLSLSNLHLQFRISFIWSLRSTFQEFPKNFHPFSLIIRSNRTHVSLNSIRFVSVPSVATQFRTRISNAASPWTVTTTVSMSPIRTKPWTGVALGPSPACELQISWT